MAERMTSVVLPSLGQGSGLAMYGRHDPHEMIRRLRTSAEIAKEEAERILSAPDSEFVVETYTGVYVQRNREQVWPTTETPERNEP